MKNLKMAQKLGMGFGCVTLLACLLGYISYSALHESANSIMKVADAYIPVSDMASSMLDDQRLARLQMRQYEFLGKKEDYKEAEKFFSLMHKEFDKAQKLSAAFPELKALAAAVKAFPPIFQGYKDGAIATDKALDNVKELLESMLASAATVEKALRDLDEIFLGNQTSFHAQGNLDTLQANGNNLYAAGEAALLFKEIRRLYANARATFDVSIREDVEKNGAAALKLLTGLESSAVRAEGKERARAATAAMQSYLEKMNMLLLGWGEIQTAAANRRDFSNNLVELLERLNNTANENAVMFAKEADTKARASTNQVLAVAGGVLVLSILLALLITRAVTRPLNQSMNFAQAVAAGNLNDVLDVQSQDEIGKLADALRSMVDSLKAKIAEANDKAEQARKMGEEAKTAMEEARLAQAAAESAKREGMLAAAHQLEGIVEIVSSASTELSAQVEEAERGAAITSERLTETATAMEEMNATVLEVARSAGNAAQVSTDAKTKAEHGATIVDNVVKCITDVEHQSTQLKADMVQLGQQAEAIGTIMSVISDIADQTNLLALNAAIEAARAGEAGRGFAVVADEVRKLAEKTMQATVEVGNTIRGVQQSAGKNMQSVDASSQIITQATELVWQAGVALKDIVSMVDTSADQVRTIATAAEEQSSTSEEINRSLGTVNNASSETARAMAEASQAISDLSQQAQKLSRLIDDMKRA